MQQVDQVVYVQYLLYSTYMPDLEALSRCARASSMPTLSRSDDSTFFSMYTTQYNSAVWPVPRSVSSLRFELRSM